MDLGPRVEPYGPLDAKIIIVGEAPGETEVEKGRPFVGSSGRELREMLAEVGINPEEVRYTNVFKHRPPNNKLDAWCVDKAELPAGYPMGPLVVKRYLRPDMLHYLEEVRRELWEHPANLIIAAGGTALWALRLGTVAKSRGVIVPTLYGKVLPIYHPSAILRQWSLRPITLCDLIKAEYESHFPEIRRPRRELWIEPTLDEVRLFFSTYVENCSELSLDIETSKKAGITCLSIAPSAELALCIPFWDPRKPRGSYWTFEEERVVWRLLRAHLTRRVATGSLRMIGQNLLYDVQHLDKAGLRIPRIDDDTMLMHHAFLPEMLKGLGFLASIYTNELSWKDMLKESYTERDK